MPWRQLIGARDVIEGRTVQAVREAYYPSYSYEGSPSYDFGANPSYSSADMGDYQPPYPTERDDPSSGPHDRVGWVDVYLPRANARLMANGKVTRQTGTHRRFETHPIDNGKPYTVQFDASWREDGRQIKQTRTLTLQPGQHKTIAFTPSRGDDSVPEYMDKVPE